MKSLVSVLILTTLSCHSSAQGLPRQQSPNHPHAVWDDLQAVAKKVNLFEMIAKSFLTLIDYGALTNALRTWQQEYPDVVKALQQRQRPPGYEPLVRIPGQ